VLVVPSTLQTPFLMALVARRIYRQTPHSGQVRDIVELRDGTLVSCSSDKTAKRWSISHDNSNHNNNDSDYDHSGVRLLTTYVGHQSEVMSVAEKDTPLL